MGLPLGEACLTFVVVPTASYRSFHARVRRREALSPTFTRVTLEGPELADYGGVCLDQRAKVVMPLPEGVGFAHFPRGDDWYGQWRGLPESQRNPFRTITVRDVRPEQCEVDIDIALHGDLGPLSRWASTCAANDEVVLIGPDARVAESSVDGIEWRPGPATQVLLAGDETAVPAIASILERSNPELLGDAYLEVPLAEDRLPLPNPTGIRVHWLVRGDRPHGEALVEAVTGSAVPPEVNSEELLWEVQAGRGRRFAWVAGEAAAVRAIRRHLVANGWDRQHVAFMGYWRSGHSEA